jgi:YHS domain-containing protein
MTPLRLLILVFLLYLGWRVVRAQLKKKRFEPHVRQDSDTQDVLVEDPVCHVLIPKNQALRLRRGGSTYYFCSERCCDQFSGQPEQGDT